MGLRPGSPDRRVRISCFQMRLTGWKSFEDTSFHTRSAAAHEIRAHRLRVWNDRLGRSPDASRDRPGAAVVGRPELSLELQVIIILIVLLLGLASMVWGTAAKNRFGINIDAVFHGDLRCPTCGTVTARGQLPDSLYHILWGGRRCLKCSCDFDKWGREIRTRASRKRGRIRTCIRVRR